MDFICIFALSFETISTTNNSKLKKSIGYEHIEKAIWWAKNYRRSENVETYFFYARACRGLGDAPRAVSMLTEAIGKRDDFYAARLLRGSILLDQAQLSEAELDATFLYEHIPGNEDVLLLKARVEKAQGKLKEAEQTYGKVMDVNPFSIDAYRERSIVRTILGDSAGAAEDEAAVKEMGAKVLEPSEGIEQKIKEKMRQMDPYKVFHNE